MRKRQKESSNRATYSEIWTTANTVAFLLLYIIKSNVLWRQEDEKTAEWCKVFGFVLTTDCRIWECHHHFSFSKWKIFNNCVAHICVLAICWECAVYSVHHRFIEIIITFFLSRFRSVRIRQNNWDTQIHAHKRTQYNREYIGYCMYLLSCNIAIERYRIQMKFKVFNQPILLVILNRNEKR